MKADIITIGDEILIGHILDSNSFWLASQLDKNGISVRKISTISDSKSQIIETIKSSLKKSDLIVLTGGLGPTNDDVTKHALCKFFDDELILNQDVLDDINKLFIKKNRVVNNICKNQALVPSKSNIIRNKNGTAPAIWFSQNKKIVVSLPGVTFEMKSLMIQFLDFLKHHIDLPKILHKVIVFNGIFESQLAELIKPWEEKLPKELKLAYLPSKGIVKLRLTAKGSDEQKLNKIIEDQLQFLYDLAGKYLSLSQKFKKEEIVGFLLKKYNKTLSIAESCTGGNISRKIVLVPGCSNYFKGSVVSYHNKIKENILEVDKNIISKYGVVSEEVVREMSSQVMRKFKTDYSVATSGYAGSENNLNNKNKNIGVVCISVGSNLSVFSSTYKFEGSREEIINDATEMSLKILLEKIESEHTNK